jgi:hypothetical protein
MVQAKQGPSVRPGMPALISKFVPGSPLPFPRDWGEVSAAAYGAELEGVVDDARSAVGAYTHSLLSST